MSTKNPDSSVPQPAITKPEFTEVTYQYGHVYYCQIRMGNSVFVQTEGATPEEAKQKAVEKLQRIMTQAISNLSRFAL